MNCHYNDEKELKCVNESIMNAYGETLTKVFSSEPSIGQVAIGLAQEAVKSMFCANCLQSETSMMLKEILTEIRRLRVTGSG